MAEGITKCAPDDPRRCQGVVSAGQCPNVAQEGSKFCKIHAGNAPKSNAARNYHLTMYQARLEKMSDSSVLKTLREELGLLRMILETTINGCKDDHDLMMSSHTISDLVMKIERLVLSCSRLDRELGRVVDQQAILTFANEIITIVSNNVDSDTTAKIADQILAALANKTTDQQ